MITMAEALHRLHDQLDRITLEDYIARAWVRPVQKGKAWHFEEIDIARIRLVHQLRHDMMVNDEAMDIVLHLLDQLYGLRDRMSRVSYALQRQPRPIQQELRALLIELDEDYQATETE